MRENNRNNNEIRSIVIEPNCNTYAHGSCSIKMGNTHVISTVTIESMPLSQANQNPQYIIPGEVKCQVTKLPRATPLRRKKQDEEINKYEDVSIAVSIEKALTSVINLNEIASKKVIIDCNIIQDDGSLISASLTSSWISTYIAFNELMLNGYIRMNPITHIIATISCGIKNGNTLVDLDYEEERTSQLLSNFTLTDKGQIIDMTSQANGMPFNAIDFMKLLELAQNKIQELINSQQISIGNYTKIEDKVQY